MTDFIIAIITSLLADIIFAGISLLVKFLHNKNNRHEDS